jgi:hypothetical protein
LENEGSLGSMGAHFEKTIFGPELMISQISPFPRFSKMALAVAKDSNWYTVDMDLAESFNWGKDEGCQIFNTSCSPSNASEFCSLIRENGCSDDHVNRTLCEISTFNANCPVNTSFENCKEFKESGSKEFTYGLESVCLRREVRV